MAIIPETQYPGKINPSDQSYPYGSARNITTPGDGTGTPWDAALVNDLFGWQQAVLAEAGVVPSGSPDKAGASQYLEAMQKLAGRTIDTVAELIASTQLPNGVLVWVKELAFAKFVIQPSGFTPLPGDQTLGTGQVAELQLGPVNDVRWWGAKGDLFNPDGTTNGSPTDDAAAIQSAANRIRLSKSGMMLDGMGLGYSMSAGVNWTQGDSGMQNFYFLPAAGFSSAGTNEAIIRTASGLRIKFRNIQIDGGGLCNGIYNESGGFHNEYSHIEIDAFLDFGILLEGSGDQVIRDCLISQYAEVADRTGVAVDIQTDDAKLFNSVIRYALIPLRINGNATMVGGCHLYNGSAGSATPATNSWNIQIVGGTGQNFSHIYLDKGRVLLSDAYSVSFAAMKYLFNSTPEHDAIFVLRTSVAGRAWPDAFVHSALGSSSTIPLNNGAMQFCKLGFTGGGSWDSAAASIRDEINLRSNGLPNLGMEATCNVRPDLETNIIKGDSYTRRHSLGSLPYGTNSNSGPTETYEAGLIRRAAGGLVAQDSASGEFSSVTKSAEGSRSGATKVAEFQLRNRQGNPGRWDDDPTAGTYWSFVLFGRTGGATDYLDLFTSDIGEGANGTRQYRFAQDFFQSDKDGAANLGGPTNRWDTVYATNGSINTSDREKKTDFEAIPVEWIDVLCSIADAVQLWRWKEAKEAKGEDARRHIGPIAQEVHAAFEAIGVDAFEFGFIGKDRVVETYVAGYAEDRDEEGEVVLDSNGEPRTVPVYAERETGEEVWNLRHHELQYAIQWAQQQKIKELLK